MNAFSIWEAEDMILKMAEIVREKRRLEEQVIILEDENKRLEEYIKDQYRMTQNHTAEILNTLINRLEESREN